MTEEGWLRKLEKGADEHTPGSTWRASVFRQIIAAAWTAGRERGYDDCRDDIARAEYTAAKQTPTKEN